MSANRSCWALRHQFRLEFEGNALYLSEEQYLHGDAADAIWIDVEGMKIKPPFSHFGLFAGTLESVTRLEPWK